MEEHIATIVCTAIIAAISYRLALASHKTKSIRVANVRTLLFLLFGALRNPAAGTLSLLLYTKGDNDI